MVDELKLARDKQLGLEAARLLGDTMFQAVVKSMRDEALEASCTTPGNRQEDVATREGFRLFVQAVDRLTAKLEAMVAKGNYAKAQLGDN